MEDETTDASEPGSHDEDTAIPANFTEQELNRIADRAEYLAKNTPSPIWSMEYLRLAAAANHLGLMMSRTAAVELTREP